MARRTIMIIDEIPDHRTILCHLLRAEGYRVLEALPDEEALDRARSEPPDLILTALSLPGRPDWEITRRLRAQPALEHTPILGTTVYNTLLSASRVRAIGCADYVHKPFDIDDLLDRISSLLPDAPHPAMAA
jgi:two-component system cell cycle response regulator DivK